jgi:hypothetical protein
VAKRQARCDEARDGRAPLLGLGGVVFQTGTLAIDASIDSFAPSSAASSRCDEHDFGKVGDDDSGCMEWQSRLHLTLIPATKLIDASDNSSPVKRGTVIALTTAQVQISTNGSP